MLATACRQPVRLMVMCPLHFTDGETKENAKSLAQVHNQQMAELGCRPRLQPRAYALDVLPTRPTPASRIDLFTALQLQMLLNTS